MNRISGIKRKINTLSIFIKNGITKPVKLGENILLLATAPCANYFFMYKSVREQFKDYDLAIINFMLLYSEKEVFELKPKYIILLDPIFYVDGLKGDIIDFDAKKEMDKILEKINWECYIVTTTLADFGLKNEYIKYIRLSFLSSKYINILNIFFKNNWLNMGINNVIHGALYFSITFGYKKVAILGCPYRHLDFYMEPDGMYIKEHIHYYDKEPCIVFLSNEQLMQRKESFTMSLYKRAYKSSQILWDLKKYADKQNVEIVNYSEESEIDAFLTKKLVVE